MKKEILSGAVMVFAFAAPFVLFTACDDDDDESTEEVSTDDSDADEDDSSSASIEAVDLGLSVKWANVNIGATLPADYGNYYAWGETNPKSNYNEDNSVTYGVSSFEDISGSAIYDAATVNWGSSWRMPTETECQELVDGCTWTWTTQQDSDGNIIYGYKVKGSNNNFIFLPAAGERKGSSLSDVGAYGYYWSSTTRAGNTSYAYYLYFYSDDHSVNYLKFRFMGLPIRPVSE